MGQTLSTPATVIAVNTPALINITVCVTTINFRRSIASATTPPAREQTMIGTARKSPTRPDRKSTRLNSSHSQISYAVFCLKKKKRDTALEGKPLEVVDHQCARVG